MNHQVSANGNDQGTSSFKDVFISFSDAESRGLGVLTVGESDIQWTSCDDSFPDWNLRFEEVNLHAIGTAEVEDDKPNNCAGYVLVQHGGNSEEVRFSSVDRNTLAMIYRAFCEGVARCPVADDESVEVNDLVDTNQSNTVLDRMDELISLSLQGENVTSLGGTNVEGDDEQDRWMDAEDETDPENADNSASTNGKIANGLEHANRTTGPS